MSVFAVTEERRNTLTLLGNVWAPGVYETSPGMRLSDLIDKAGGLRDDTYLGRVQIVRLDPLDLSQSAVPASLAGGGKGIFTRSPSSFGGGGPGLNLYFSKFELHDADAHV